MQMWNKMEQACSSWQWATYFISMCLWSNSILCPIRVPCGFVRCRSCPATANAAAWCGSSNHGNWVLWRSLALHWKLHVTRMLILMWFLPVLGIFGIGPQNLWQLARQKKTSRRRVLCAKSAAFCDNKRPRKAYSPVVKRLSRRYSCSFFKLFCLLRELNP